jgi:5-methylcytosine-specific restriction endonuclease McrA
VVTDYLKRHSPKERRKRREERRAKTAGANQAASGAKSRGDRPSGASGHCRRRQSRTGDSNRRSRHIPSEVCDEVFTRDGGRCTYVARDGTRCGSIRSLQIDHIRPFAAGGSHDLSNLRLLCARHNRLVAEKTLGEHVMSRYWRKE